MLKAWKNAYQKKTSNNSQSEASREVSKDHILDEIGRSIKLLLQYSICKEVIKTDCWIVSDVCLHLNAALNHGLRKPALGYWPFVRLYTHANNIQLLENSASQSIADQGRAWLHNSLNEGSLESYLRLFSSENAALHKQYLRDALLRDPARREILLGILASIRDLRFELRLEQSEAERSVATPLPSPEDSGVALLDSDLSEPLDSLQDDQDGDTATLNELEDNRINRLLSLEMDTAGKSMDPCITQLNSQTEKKGQEKSEKIVLRTPKKSANDSNRHLKRVSFHEECFSQTDFSVSFISPGTAVPKKDTIKGRYSWCAGGDAPFIVCDTELKTNSICVLQSESREERGVPEGQEDDSSFSERPVRIQAEMLKIKHQLLKKQSKAKKNLKWPGAKPNPQACEQLLQELELEIEYNLHRDIVAPPVTAETLNIMRNNFFFNPLENIYKVFKAHGPLMQAKILPLLVVLTNKALYVLSLESCTNFECHFALAYRALGAILLGPSGQTVLLSSEIKEDIFFAMSDTDSASSLVAHTELAMRRVNLPLPPWRILAMEDMRMLWHNLAQMEPSLQGERLMHLCLVHLQDETKQCSPIAASKEGLLMMRIGHIGPWMPAFLGLRETELWVYGDEVEREPQLVLSLARCQGCHRAPMPERPHTFEIVCGRGSAPLQLAAADEYEASDWLQALVQAASGPAQKQEGKLQLCGLVLTAGHLLAYSLEQQLPHLLCCAELTHLTAMKIQSVSSTWCVLEFDCSEAHESSGDWIIYFSSQVARARFCAQLEAVWPTLFEEPFPSISSMAEDIVKRCRKTSLHLHTMWDPMLSLGYPSNTL